MKQPKLFEREIELIKVDSVIGSGYEEEVSKLALIDKKRQDKCFNENPQLRRWNEC